MSVRTLASVFVDCLDERNWIIRDNSKHAANSVIDYMTNNRLDDLSIFGQFVHEEIKRRSVQS